MKLLSYLPIGILTTFMGSLLAQNIYFNTNDLSSDVTGDFDATVLFAQNSIIPSKNTIPGDVQPRLTSKRKTLILFKPKVELDASTDLQVTLTDNDDPSVSTTLTMKPPSELPPIAGVDPTIEYSSIDFSIPSSYARTFQGSATLNTIKDDLAGDSIASYLSAGDVSIRTADGAWIGEFYLPAGTFDRKVVFVSNAGYGSTIHFGERLVNISRGETLVFAQVNGEWVLEGDQEIAKIQYGEGFWTTTLPGHLITPGIELTFEQNNLSTTLEDIEVGGYNQVIVHTINLGMLTPYDEGMLFQSNEEYQRQYFQQIPASQLIVSAYEPQFWEEIMLPNGTFLDSIDYTSDGGIYTGSMRQSIGKILVSQGVNLANYGIFSTTATSEYGYLASQVTAHKSRGHYRNGIQEHGLSGGAGMVTLSSTIGNEWSHELGHNWGLGHYVGGFDGSIHRPADQINSTWGWDSDSNFFIPNFNSTPSNAETCLDADCQAAWNGFQFNKDAMAGGNPTFEGFNRFTLHTPFVLEKIQKFYEGKMVFAPHQNNGFEKWNPSTLEMENFEHQVQLNSNTLTMKPDEYGVPVTTIIGYYDPEKTLTSYIYPALYGSYGMYYEPPENVTSTCALEVSFASGSKSSYPLTETRFTNNNMNKFHVNVPTSMNPQSAQVICDQQQQASRVFEAPSFQLTANKVGLGQLEEEATTSLRSTLAQPLTGNLVRVQLLDQHYDVQIRDGQNQFSIVNLSGQEIQRLNIVNNEVRWDGMTRSGTKAQPGVYYFTLNGFKKPIIIQ